MAGMTSEGLTRRGRLRLNPVLDSEQSTARHPTVDESTQDLNVAPAAVVVDLDLGVRFVDHGEIARGGMSTIRRVTDKSLNRDVAMKVLRADLGADLRSRYRFIEEAQVTGQLEHPNIVPVYEIGVDDAGTYYFTMKLIRGQTLNRYLDALDAATPEERLYRALQIFLKVCDALAFAHDRGVIHRDLKPENIMVGEYGQVYLMDWGIARLRPGAGRSPEAHHQIAVSLKRRIEEPGTVIGTYAYMPPEQARGDVDAMDERSDVFSLGAVLYRILTDRPPYDGAADSEMLALAQRARVPPPESVCDRPLPGALCRIAMRALSADPADRQQSVAELRREIEEMASGRWRFPVARFAAGSAIVREGEHGDAAYVIRSGHCQVVRWIDGERKVLRRMGPGEVFGETAVFAQQPRSATVEALDDVEVWVVAGAALSHELGLDSWMGAFVRTLGQRFTEASQLATRLQQGVDQARALAAIYRYAAQHGTPLPDGAREVDWPALCRALVPRLGCTENDLERVAEGEPGLRLIPGQGGILSLIVVAG
ncbi:MAG: protein kinase [Deltaproteobacteria bacterium]|nr:protein kinase [Deltaproteobacteria bacterium]